MDDPVTRPETTSGTARGNAASLSWKLCAGWGIGTLTVGILFNTTNMLLMRYLTDYVGLAAALAGALISLSKIYDAATDPLMGWISDNTRSRFGRRRVWLLLGAVLCGVALVALFNVPLGWSGTALTVYVLALLLFYASAYTVFGVPYMAMPAEMTDDYHERSTLMSYRVAFIGAAQVLAGYCAPLLVVAFGEGRAGHAGMSWVLGAAIMVSGAICFFATKSARATAVVATPRTTLRQQLASVMSNRPFVLLIGAKLGLLLAVASFSTTLVYFFVHVLQASYSLLGLFSLVSTIAMFASIPVWLRLSKRLDKRCIFIIAGALYALLSLTWLLAGPGEPMIWVMVRSAAMGVFGCGTLLAGQALLPDTIEYDYLRTGLRREALFAGFYTTTEKVAFALGLAFAGLLLGAMGYVSSTAGGATLQPASALLGISLCVSLVPAVTLLLGCLFMREYDLSEAKLGELRAAAAAVTANRTPWEPTVAEAAR